MVPLPRRLLMKLIALQAAAPKPTAATATASNKATPASKAEVCWGPEVVEGVGVCGIATGQTPGRLQPLTSALPFVQGSGAPKDLASVSRPRRVDAEHAMAAIASDATTRNAVKVRVAAALWAV